MTVATLDRPSPVRGFLKLVVIEHSIFALPFAYIAAFTAMRHDIEWRDLAAVTIAMVAGRTFAMAANRVIDGVLILPAAEAYRGVFPYFVQDRFRNVLNNLAEPRILANNLLQRRWSAAGTTFSRFVLNSTAGVAPKRRASRSSCSAPAAISIARP